MYKLLFAFLIFAEYFESNIKGFNYWDEAATIFALLYAVLIFVRKGKIEARKKDFLNWLCLLIMLGLGILGNILHPGIQESTAVVVKDIAAFSKFFIVIFALQLNSVDDARQKRILTGAAGLSRAFILIIFAAAVITYPSGALFYTGEIRTVKCFRFIFSHPTFLVSSCVMMAMVLIAESVDKNRLFLLLTCAILFLAQRTKGYIAILVIVVFFFMGEKRAAKWIRKLVPLKRKQVFSPKLWGAILVCGVAMFALAYEKIADYIRWGMTSARIVLYVIGFRIIADFFPLGSGFGTFASSLSGESYSNIYDMYGVSNVQGMTREYYGYLGDTFWPFVFGQLGFLGLIIYIGLLYGIVKDQLKRSQNNNSILAVIFVWCYVLFASVVEAYFTNSSGVQFALALSIFVGVRSNKRIKDEEK